MKDLRLLSSMLPRGLAAAAVSQLPATPKYVDKIPKLPYMQELVISIIIFSVAAAAIGSYIYGRSEESEVKENTSA